MADNEPPVPTKHSSGVGMLTDKWGPLPVWAWLGMGVLLLAYYLYKKKQSTGGLGTSNLGSPSQLPNLFQVAGPMPYTGGGTTVSVTNNIPGPGHHKKSHNPEKYPGKANKFLTKSGSPRKWVQKRLHIGPGPLDWTNKYFTNAGQPRHWDQKFLSAGHPNHPRPKHGRPPTRKGVNPGGPVQGRHSYNPGGPMITPGHAKAVTVSAPRAG